MIEEKKKETERNKYVDHPIYKKITDAITFDGEKFSKELDVKLDPKNSPLPPPNFVNAIRASKVENKQDVYGA